eukprot:11985588-Heterocapsa_arctica.AAC.1
MRRRSGRRTDRAAIRADADSTALCCTTGMMTVCPRGRTVILHQTSSPFPSRTTRASPHSGRK